VDVCSEFRNTPTLADLWDEFWDNPDDPINPLMTSTSHLVPPLDVALHPNFDTVDDHMLLSLETQPFQLETAALPSAVSPI
jgi:hypothetical protein